MSAKQSHRHQSLGARVAARGSVRPVTMRGRENRFSLATGYRGTGGWSRDFASDGSGGAAMDPVDFLIPNQSQPDSDLSKLNAV